MSVYLHFDLGTREQWSEQPEGFSGPLHALGVLARVIDTYGPLRRLKVPVALVTSTVGGLGAVGTDRCALVGVSPAMGGYVGETRAEGPYAAGMRAAGVTGISLTGIADRLSYVVVSDGRAELRDADGLWGMDTRTATEQLVARHGPGTAVAVIGPAGENLSAYANVVTCGDFPLPRRGFGTVLGFRKIKAIVCVPSGSAPVPADPAAVVRLGAAYRAEMPGHPLAGWQHAVPGFGAWSGTTIHPGQASVLNFSDTGTAPAAWPGLHPDRYAAYLARSGGGCPGCPNDCVKSYAGAGLHQEAVAMLGPNLGIADLGAILAANARCQELGLDPVSLGGTLGCLFEAMDRGAVPGWPADTLPAGTGFGAADVLPELVERAACYGDPLGFGASALGGRIGEQKFSMISRWDELPPFDPRVQPGLGLMYAAAPAGPRYDAIEHDLDFDPEHGLPHAFAEARRLGLTVPAPASVLDVERTIRLADLWSGLDALMICPYASTPTRPLSLDRVAELVRAVTGRPFAPDDVFTLGRERLRRQQAINDRLGHGAGTLPDRFFDEPVAAGVHRGAVLDRAAFASGLARLRAAWS